MTTETKKIANLYNNFNIEKDWLANFGLFNERFGMHINTILLDFFFDAFQADIDNDKKFQQYKIEISVEKTNI